jgi:coenzyme PQQ precursor peptide PqqA
VKLSSKWNLILALTLPGVPLSASESLTALAHGAARSERQRAVIFGNVLTVALNCPTALASSVDPRRIFPLSKGSPHMNWTTPRVIEIAVGMEINCYASAKL